MTATQTYVGIADAHGIESFTKDQSQKSLLVLRASFNRQRHAVAYEVDLDDEQAEHVRRMIDNKSNDERFEDALKYIKSIVPSVGLAGGGDVQGSWELIPDPKLDPWSEE